MYIHTYMYTHTYIHTPKDFVCEASLDWIIRFFRGISSSCHLSMMNYIH